MPRTRVCVNCEGEKAYTYSLYCRSCAAKIRWDTGVYEGSFQDPKLRAMHSKIAQDMWNDPEFRARRSLDMTRVNYERHLAGVYTPVVTEHELIVANVLDMLSIGYEHQFSLVDEGYGKRYYYDLMLPEFGLIIEVDGVNHKYADIRAKDQVKTALARHYGYDVWRITNRQVEGPIVVLLTWELT